jgi:hypothetical protein
MGNDSALIETPLQGNRLAIMKKPNSDKAAAREK